MDYHILLHSNPMSKHYNLLYFVHLKAETSYLLRSKTKIWTARYKASDPTHHALYCPRPVEQTIYIVNILGYHIKTLDSVVISQRLIIPPDLSSPRPWSLLPQVFISPYSTLRKAVGNALNSNVCSPACQRPWGAMVPGRATLPLIALMLTPKRIPWQK